MTAIIVPAEWPKGQTVKLAFVGEAPGTEEEQYGRPFVGPSGRIFNAMLRGAGIERQEVYVGNVFNEKLPNNEVSNWCAPMGEAVKGGFADLPPIGNAGVIRPEFRHHLDRLNAELDRVQPNVIVPLGATALWAFNGATDISQRRGALDVAVWGAKGRKIIPTFHPAFIMRQWKFLPVAVGDFIKAATESHRGPSMVYPARELMVEPDYQDLQRIKPRLLASDLLSVDIETSWGQVTEVSLAPDRFFGVSVPFVDKFRASRHYWPTEDAEFAVWEWLREVLESPVPKLGQNFAFYDAIWLLERTTGIKVRNFAHDTRLLHHAIHPELPKDLAFLGGAYTELGPWKTYRERKSDKRDE